MSFEKSVNTECCSRKKQAGAVKYAMKYRRDIAHNTFCTQS